MAPSPHKGPLASTGGGGGQKIEWSPVRRQPLAVSDQANEQAPLHPAVLSSSSSSSAAADVNCNLEKRLSLEPRKAPVPIWTEQNVERKREELDQQLATAKWVKDFFTKSEGSALRAWLRHFDQDNNNLISHSEFMRGMRRLDFAGDIGAAFSALDQDHSGELSLEEIDSFQAGLWRRFRTWCAAVFEGPENMVHSIGGWGDNLRRGSKTGPLASLDLKTFVEGVRRLGWQEGCEEILYHALDVDGTNELTCVHLRWLELYQRRMKRKEDAKKIALRSKALKKDSEKDRKAIDAAFNEFKIFLKRKFGHYVRAWRRDISPDGLLTIHKRDLFKACSAIGWNGDVRHLWAAFDKDGSGDVSIEELDPKGAELLAHFRKFVVERFGNTPATFRALDKFNIKKLKRAEFLAGLKGFGFEFSAKSLFCGLDLDCKKFLVEENLCFLDRWKPPAFLTAVPSRQAADEFKACLLKAYKNRYLVAWRRMDVDGSNSCSWNEFTACCKKLGFNGDVAGAWRALDEDMSGYITLAEIDRAASDTLGNFKKWADEEFGGVRSAFTVFDCDESKNVTYREFRRTCRAYGYELEDPKVIFKALDTENNGTLGLDEVVFLDDWHFQDRTHEDLDEEVAQTAPKDARGLYAEGMCTRYETDGPGPNIAFPPTLGSGPAVPMLRFSGAFSFRKRPERLPNINKDAEWIPSPQHYDAAKLSFSELTARSKPAFSWGSSPQRGPESSRTGPGPGAYGLQMLADRGVAAICSPRRPLRVHPLFKGHLETRPLTDGAQPGGPCSARLPPRLGC